MALSQHGTVAPVIIHQRTGFATSMIDGRTVMELAGNEQSAREIEQLWAYLDQRLAAKLATIPSPTPVSSGREEGATWAA